VAPYSLRAAGAAAAAVKGMAEDLLIGEVLVARGAVSRAAVEEASLAAHAAGERLCSRLLATGMCDERDLAAALAARHGMPGVDLSRTVVDLAVLDFVPRNVAETDLVFPLSAEGGRIHLAVDSPLRAEQTVAEVRFVTGREVSTYMAVLGALQAAIAQAYEARERGAAVWRGARGGDGGPRIEAVLQQPPPEPPTLPDEALEPIPDALPADIDIVDTADQAEVVHSIQVLPGPARILVVDDEPAIRLLVQRALQSKGYAVDTAADGAEALEKVRARPPELLLLDAMLPRLHGFEVARRVRSDAATRQVPIVIMTAVYRGWRFAQDARESYGAEDYVEKPFRVDDLLRRVELVLEATASRAGPGPSPAEPLLARGRELLAAGDTAAAAAAFEEAARADSFSAEAHYQLGRALRTLNDGFRAMTALERAVDLRPGLFPGLRALAALYQEKGFRRKAAETLERAVGAAPDDGARQAVRAELLKLL